MQQFNQIKFQTLESLKNKKIIIKKSNSGMKFLLVNLVKDFVWISFWIYKLDKDLEIFFYIISVFLINSFLLYYVVIKKLNSI